MNYADGVSALLMADVPERRELEQKGISLEEDRIAIERTLRSHAE